ncbi:hypothetical protein FRB94_013344 [Tulasnella sp. JGI-2019a]|nr:hypothetical protein FRB94_013344 [Tulasnella sp. JGI-2019a]KAG9008705.1 hypothetical protein FRB93_006251 [Tulasnella sp. JGI-2019a]KAG9032573.1 hypothetical protein FRB95_001238 [Tulasnella sp. JGI-2019a]
MESRTLGRKIGTINVVVLKARILPNKQGLRKQCSYCVLELNGETRRINVVNDVGDYIEWNEELQFPIYEGANDEKVITLSCHAEDPVQPTLIGERNVSLNNAFLSGKSDGWFGLMRKNRHVGEIYLKITFRLEVRRLTGIISGRI